MNSIIKGTRRRKPRPDFSREKFEEVTYAGYYKSYMACGSAGTPILTAIELFYRAGTFYENANVQSRWEGWMDATRQHFMHDVHPDKEHVGLHTCIVCGASEIELTEGPTCKERVLQKESEARAKRIVARFDEEEWPQFSQGEPTHELQDDVTAEQCTIMMRFIRAFKKRFPTTFAEVEAIVRCSTPVNNPVTKQSGEM